MKGDVVVEPAELLGHLEPPEECSMTKELRGIPRGYDNSFH